MSRLKPVLCASLLFTLCLTPLDRAAAETPPESPIVGRGQELIIVPDLSRSTVVGATSYWTRLVTKPQSSFLKLHMVNVNLRPGDVLTLRSRTGQVVEEITGRGPNDLGTFWSLSAFGDEIYLELAYHGPYATLPFRIDEVLVGLPGLLGAGVGKKSVCSPEHFDDVWCYQGDAGKWANVLGSVGVMTVGSNPTTGLWCSGSNVSPQNYLLTNNHCITDQGDCNNAEFVFRYYRQGCNNGAATTGNWQGFRCDQLVAMSPFSSCDQGLNDLDFSLCSVIGDPAATFGFVQPDPVPLTDGEAIYIIQHPAGRPHEITHGSGNDVDVDGTVLRYYDTLDTEGGSSGSPIYRESDDKLIGLHHCGGCSTPGVGNRGMLMSDIYPHIQQFLCSGALGISTASYQGLGEVIGNGDAVLDPGETWEFSPVVSNTSCSTTANNVTADIQINAGSVPVTVLTPTASFGNVPGGSSAASTSPVQFQIAPQAPCSGSVVLDLVNIDASNGGPFGDSLNYLDAQLGGPGVEVLYYEDFATGLGDWTIQDNGNGSGPASTWTTANPGGRSPALSAPFAIADSAAHGAQAMNEIMVSMQIDASGRNTLTLQFNHEFNHVAGGGNERARVQVKRASGFLWETKELYDNADASGMVQTNLDDFAGFDDVQIRFHYLDANNDGWWAVDDVFVLADGAFTCGGDFFTQYGAGCAGSGGFTPDLDGAGSATPGGLISLDVSAGQPNSVGFLLAAGTQNLTPCLLVLPPLQIYGLNLDPTGSASLSGEVAGTVSPGSTFFLQWVGLDSGGPPRSYSNGLQIDVD